MRFLPSTPTYVQSLFIDPLAPRWGLRVRAIAVLVKPFPIHTIQFLSARAERRWSRGRAEAAAISLEFTGHWDAAVSVRTRMVERQPDDPRLLYALAKALQNCGTEGLQLDSIIGLTTGRVQGTDQARGPLSAALEADPGSALIRFELGSLELRSGNAEQALEHLKAATSVVPNATWLLELGRAHQRPEVSDFVSAAAAYARALEIEPHNARALSRLASVSVRTNDWRTGWSTLLARQLDAAGARPALHELLGQFEACLYGESSATEPQKLVDRLDRLLSAGESVDRELLRQISARLQFLGQFTIAYQVKDLIARQVLFETRWLRRSDEHLLSRLSALAVLNRPEEISELFLPAPWTPQTELQCKRFEKYLADAWFAQGNAQPLREFAMKQRSEHPLPGDAVMIDLIRGKRVAIVGPSDLGEQNGSEIDAFDTVIRPRFNKAFVDLHRSSGGARTDISYYSSTDIGPLIAESEAAAASGEIQLAVTRPLAYAALSNRAGADAWLRFYRHEYSLHFMASPLGIPRMVYDVLQFEPSEVRIFNTDLYTGNSVFATGYRDARDVSLAANSLLNDLFRSHDLRAEFTLFKALRSTGEISAAGRLAEILNCDASEYLRLLESSATFSQ